MTAPPPSLATALADRYRLEREIGAGGMATVYLARDVKHDRNVALKVLQPELGAVLGVERFLSEIRVTANLQHPHLLPLFDSGEAAGLLFYVMPFVEGETLRARLEREQQLPIDEAVRFATSIAGALAHAHAHGVIHRDLKPENILLQAGQPVISDFGIALAVSNAGGARVTQTGISLGTPQYMSPEQAAGDRTIDARSDIYSLGAITYEMLAGEPPFVGPTAQAIVAKVLTETPRHLAAQRPSVPPHVDDAVHTALEKLPADRFATAEAFASALTTPSHVRTAAPAAGRSARRRRPLRRRLPSWRRSPLCGAGPRSPEIAPRRAMARLTSDRGSRRSRCPTAPNLAVRSPFRPMAQGSCTKRARTGSASSGCATPGRSTRGPFMVPTVRPTPRSRLTDAESPSLRATAFASRHWTMVESRSSRRLATHSLLNWADDENILISARGGIERVPLNGGARQRVTTVDTAGGEVFNTAPTPLSGGQSILFVVIPQNYGDNSRFQIAVSDPRTGRHRALLPGFWARYVEPGYLLVVRPDSALVAVPFDVKTQTTTGPPIVLASDVTIPGNSFPEIAVASTGQLVFATGGANSVRVRFARVRRDGASTIVDSTWVGQAREIAVSPDGAHAAAVVSRGTWDIQERDLRTGAVSYVSVPATVAQDPVFTSDGKSLLFIASGPQGGKVYEVPVGSASAPHLVFDNASANFYEPAPSPDGRTLYYGTGMGGRRDIYAHALDQPGSSDRAVVATDARERSPRPSPDGRWLAYVSDESGTAEIYVRSTDASRSERWQVSAGGGRVPRWARNGRELFFLSRDSLMAAEVSSGAEFGVGMRRSLFPIARFNGDTYDVLPGDAGFLMLQTESGAGRKNQTVFVDRWSTLLAAKGRR